MDTKLTLNIDSAVIKKVKLYSRKQGRSLSDLVENYFKALSGKFPDNQVELTPKVKSLLGSFNLPEDFDYKKELSDQIMKKYL
jgi:hypothetical protein